VVRASASVGASRGYRTTLDDLGALRVFVAVVEVGSLTDAAHRLSIMPSTVSKHLSGLEAKVSGQLIIRSTKQLHVTELGRRFYDRCVAILHEVDEAEIEIGQYNAEPQGVLRISAAPVFASRHLMPIFARFLERHPKIKLDLTLTNTEEDLIASGIDAAIRISLDLHPSLIALKLAPNVRIFCAAPSYIEKFGRPASVADLVNHNCLVVRNVTQSANWPMMHADGHMENILVSGTFTCDNGDMLRQALLTGIGIGHLASFMVHDHILSGELIELFPESRVVASHIYVVYPKKRNMPLKIRAFVDHLKAEFSTPAPWTLP
jgi:DNA-binding transcriptional LysR family regulator